jgi:iron complex transport system ATP-binding protein
MIKNGKIFAAGNPKSVVTEENIEAVYGIKSHVTNSVIGRPQVTPLESETNRIMYSFPSKIATKQ